MSGEKPTRSTRVSRMSDRIQASARRLRSSALASVERREKRASARREERSSYRMRRAALAESTPYLAMLRTPATPTAPASPGRRRLVVASYNVHRWMGRNGRSLPDPTRAVSVIADLDAHVIALQEVLRPFRGDDPLEAIADALQVHVAFATTRVHRRGELGNAVLSVFPIRSAEALDISFSRIERRAALAARIETGAGSLGIVATHLSLVDGTRSRQVRQLLNHPHFDSGPVLLLGDMNAWRRDRASRALDRELRAHDNQRWPASFPSARPVLALDRIYARGADVVDLSAHTSPEARRASDHLPVVARVEMRPA